jgi:carbamate kinase
VLIVVGLGGNALLRPGDPLEAEVQRRNVKVAAAAVAELAREHQVVVTHGNGPQVGLLALQSEAYRDVRSYPLDVLGAESEGMIGYVLEQELENALPGRDVATLVTQVVVDAADPAFQRPSRPVGPAYSHDDAGRLATERGWAVAPDGDRWRRVVASPVPRDIVELHTIELLVDEGVLVVCAGGGGIPVVLDANGALHGVEAMIDKDRAAALLARQLGADLLVFLTNVPAVFADRGTSAARAVERATPTELRTLALEVGTMWPKVDAARWFAGATGRPAAIGALAEAAAIVRGEAGTRVTVDGPSARDPGL